MHLVALGWIYVVGMMALVEAFAPNGTVLGAVFTFLLYGALPLSIVMYVMATPARRRARALREAAAAAAPVDVLPASAPGAGDGGDHPAGAAVPAEREER